MVKILIDRAVVEQALDALDFAFDGHADGPVWEALCTLRAALEQQEVVKESLTPEQEPVAEIRDGTLHWYIPNPAQSLPLELLRGAHPLYLHQQNLNCKSNQARLATLWGYVKEQPKREPLTDEQIRSIYERPELKGSYFPALKKIARAVEAAHGIKEQK